MAYYAKQCGIFEVVVCVLKPLSVLVNALLGENEVTACPGN